MHWGLRLAVLPQLATEPKPARLVAFGFGARSAQRQQLCSERPHAGLQPLIHQDNRLSFLHGGRPSVIPSKNLSPRPRDPQIATAFSGRLYIRVKPFPTECETHFKEKL